ncbi:NifU family protein [Enterobacteriaceae endosymbiont of Macroplea appendiculata]|uniref:NifU family protein n=1 Tax=Enterobacteriaceae endosymbiont of Macroplea appendiculata TaxID=2675790 RepID=UPI0014568F91|nr:NifU family protein [Enterobacteriaceae endosymbiont of Macroplea appendiculata]
MNKKIEQNTDIKKLEKKIRSYIINIINPILLKHGGSLQLKTVTIEKIALVKFIGGCQGCAMSQHTLNNWIVKELLNNFTELTNVQDITMHDIHHFTYYK